MKNSEVQPTVRHCFEHTNHWLVERLVGNEEIEIATFHGLDAEQRAKEYTAWRYGKSKVCDQ